MKIINLSVLALFIGLLVQSCQIKAPISRQSAVKLPGEYPGNQLSDSIPLQPTAIFPDTLLQQLISKALSNNQELAIAQQEILIAAADAKARKADYLPFVGFSSSTEIEKVGRFTSQGANDANTPMSPGKIIPENLPNFKLGLQASWELDIWHRLRNARQAAIKRYLASVEGRNFLVTELVAEIARSYYELMALDNELAIVNQSIGLQSKASEVIKIQKEATRVTELAVKRFQAQLQRTQSLAYTIKQEINATENHLNFLLGRMPESIQRNSTLFVELPSLKIPSGQPLLLLENRPDIRKAELELQAANLDVQQARALFYPSLSLGGFAGYDAYTARKLLSSPESMAYKLFGELIAPLVNRNALKANFSISKAKKEQALLNYEKTLLSAYSEVMTQQSAVQNLEQSFNVKKIQVGALEESVDIANNLFNSARADYVEVLLTQRESLESKFELLETKKEQFNASIALYRSLGGGWK